jgi:3-methyladenine DNA glycosylase AlkD
LFSTLDKIRKDLRDHAKPGKAEILSRFFKTGKGQYGEGDLFLGVMVPEQRKIAKKYPDCSLDELRKLLFSRIHEERLVSLLILITKYKTADEKQKKRIVDFYLSQRKQINNWDLVDLSSGNILGDYLLDKERSVLSRLAKSENLWERRIAIMSTFAFIRKNQFDDTLAITKQLLRDPDDLIHKAAGWMLREVGKRDQRVEERFLRKHYREMPRTMLRYAIERFDEKKKRFYLRK